MELNIGDKVYKFYNGLYDSGINVVVEADENGYGIIPTDCKINGVEPTTENTKPERYDKDGKAFIVGMCALSIHKATPELKEKVGKYGIRRLLVEKICKELNIYDRNGIYNKTAMSKLFSRSTKQLFAIFLLLFDKADGKRGLCNIDENGKLNCDFFVEEELINEVREPKE